MRQSQLFSKTRREAPADELSKNAQLLIRAGYIHKEMAGVYSFLPLGLRVLNKVVGVIREEMNSLGAIELYLSALQDRKVWEATDRWNEKKVPVWFKTTLQSGSQLGLGFTHEEPITRLMKDHIRSFRDLPVYAYQFQTKFRNEERAKSGVMRCREFLMKDLYSFAEDTKSHDEFYEKVKQAYTSIFSRLGIGEETMLTYASGGSFSKYSHEFQTLTTAGEDQIHVCEKCHVAVNEEIIREQSQCPLCGNKKLKKKISAEVGNIFSLGTKFSEALKLQFVDRAGETRPVVMGSYGIGPGRLLGTIAELRSDEKGLVWPEIIAPFAVHLVSLAGKDEKVIQTTDNMYANLLQRGIEVLYDDRDLSAGEKLKDSDLVGIPYRLVVSDRTLHERAVEVKPRTAGSAFLMPEKDAASGKFLTSSTQ